MSDITKWKLVPMEPTDAMIRVGIDAPLANTGDDAVDEPQDYRNVYSAMISAAPELSSGAPARSLEFEGLLRRASNLLRHAGFCITADEIDAALKPGAKP